MVKSGMNLQDSFLNQVRKDNTEIQLVLLDGARLTGYVRGFDNFTVIMNSRGQQHLIYKHAIAQIISRKPTHPEVLAGEAAEPEGEAPTANEAPVESRPASERPEEAPRRDERPRRERDNRPRRDEHARRDENERGREDASRRDKFNAIDLSALKSDQEVKS